MAHIHVRAPQTGALSVSVDLFREVITDIKSRCNMVPCLSPGAGLGMTAEQRAVSVRAFKPEPASLNFGSINFALFPQLSRCTESRVLKSIKDPLLESGEKRIIFCRRIHQWGGER